MKTKMNRLTSVLLLVLISMYLFTGCKSGSRVGGDETRPNLVFVFADQLRYDRLGYTGDTRAITPNIDRLTLEGMNFSNTVVVTPVFRNP